MRAVVDDAALVGKTILQVNNVKEAGKINLQLVMTDGSKFLIVPHVPATFGTPIYQAVEEGELP